MIAMVPSVFGNFSFKGLDHLFRQLLKESSRDYDHLILFCFAKNTQHATWPIIEGNKWSNPRGASVIGVVHFHALLSLN